MPLLDWPQPVPSCGVVLFASTEPPGMDAFGGLRDRGFDIVADATATPGDWTLRIGHPTWGRATLNGPIAKVAKLVAASASADGHLTRTERETVTRARSGVTLTVDALGESPFVARKRFLRFAFAVMGTASVGVVDLLSQRIWSRGALEDELSIDAELDVEGLYIRHMISNSGPAPEWLHTHGLGEIGAFDLDILNPDVAFSDLRLDTVRAIAFTILERRAQMGEELELAEPEGTIAFVPAEQFMRAAAPEHVALRDSDAATDEAHLVNRAVVCEPESSPFAMLAGRPTPSIFLSAPEPEGMILQASKAVSDFMARRARASFPLLRATFDALRGDADVFVKLAYDSELPALPKEHLWFRAHGFRDDAIDATLLSAPFGILSMQAGARGWHGIDRLSDWKLGTPYGPVFPWFTAHSRTARRRAR